jgi:hypothetical protein
MANEFVKPQFDSGSLELRCEDDCVCIYGTSEGLRELAKLCLSLADGEKERHIHLEDYVMLTRQSRACAIAVFDRPAP